MAIKNKKTQKISTEANNKDSKKSPIKRKNISTEKEPALKKSKAVSDGQKTKKPSLQKPFNKAGYSKNARPKTENKNFIKKDGDGDAANKESGTTNTEKKNPNNKFAKKPPQNPKKIEKNNLKSGLKPIYEKLKCKNNKDKLELAKELYSRIKSNKSLIKLVMAHDSSRIIQCLYKHAPADIRQEIAEELIPMSVEMAVSKYAHFIIKAILKCSDTPTKMKLIDSFYGNIVKLVSNSVSSGIIDTIYCTLASTKQRIFLKQEFYGDLYKESKDDKIKCVSDVYENATDLKAGILGALKSNLEHIGNKKIVDNALIHTILLEYLEVCSDEDRSQIVALYSPLIPSLGSTKEGSKAAILCFWHSDTKERRAIVKSIKEHLPKLCVHEFGHILLIAIINCLDDTKASKKSILDYVCSNLKDILNNSWGRKLVEWCIAPGDTAFFHPEFISFMDEGLKYSKKDKEIRRKEIYDQIESSLCEAICSDPSFWVKDGYVGLVTATLLSKMSTESYKKAAQSIAKILCKPDWVVCVTPKPAAGLNKTDSEKSKTTKLTEKINETILGIEDPGLHVALKKILKNRREDSQFSTFLLENLTEETINVWIKINRACFVLVSMCENCPDSTKLELKKLMKSYITTLKGQKFAGAKLLVEKLNL